MDTLVLNGDFVIDFCGFPAEIHSIDEACQRVRFALSVNKGTFIYDRDFGADFDYLINSDNLDKSAKIFCEEALTSQKEISVGEVTAEKTDGEIILNVEVIYNGLSQFTEVKINANV